MKVVPLAAESLGVRSMATYVEAAGVGLLLDPGASLAASRFGLPPAALGPMGRSDSGLKTALRQSCETGTEFANCLGTPALPGRLNDLF